ncbi:pyridoxal-phosphate dependent enzyme [Streptomyces sp. NPDC001276]|uniref:pyridoxal-phosphate dependent enzyme n=1 Tax=Streptomyces sp. NPDC001276 TaxID=3364555 RepID=UPI00367FBD08
MGQNRNDRPAYTSLWGGVRGNLVLDGLLDARIVWAGDADADRLAQEATAVTERLRRQGERPALIPFGGSSPLAARGYLRCAEELMAQVADLRHAVVALGSGGTMAGLVAGLGAERVLGVDTGARAPRPGLYRPRHGGAHLRRAGRGHQAW